MEPESQDEPEVPPPTQLPRWPGGPIDPPAGGQPLPGPGGNPPGPPSWGETRPWWRSWWAVLPAVVIVGVVAAVITVVLENGNSHPAQSNGTPGITTPSPTTTPTGASAPPSPNRTSPAERSLAQREQQLRAKINGESVVLVQVPAGFQAASYNQSGRIRFWFESTAGRSWRQIGESRYPFSPALGPPDASATGALLRRMSDATFIVRGLFSADGRGNAVAFTGGPRGWGAIKAEPGGNIGPSGQPVGADQIGLSYDFAFRNGFLETKDCPTDRPTYQCGAHAIVKLWEWQTNDFIRVR